jgi:hypothetical protein
MSDIHFRLHFSPFQIQLKLLFLFSKAPLVAILDVRNSFSFAFRHFFFQDGSRRPFWMCEIHFHLHFSPFQIKMHFFFFKMNGHLWFPIHVCVSYKLWS